MSRRILVTGSRNWTDREVISDALAAAFYDLYSNEHGAPILVSGACPTGADRIAEELWEERALPVERHPARWSEGKSAGPRRNQEMVDLGADICLAFPLPDSRGTKHCMGAAEKAGIPVRIYEPAADRKAAESV